MAGASGGYGSTVEYGGYGDGSADFAGACWSVADVERIARAIHAERLARTSREERISESYRRLVRAILGGPMS